MLTSLHNLAQASSTSQHLLSACAAHQPGAHNQRDGHCHGHRCVLGQPTWAKVSAAAPLSKHTRILQDLPPQGQALAQRHPPEHRQSHSCEEEDATDLRKPESRVRNQSGCVRVAVSGSCSCFAAACMPDKLQQCPGHAGSTAGAATHLKAVGRELRYPAHAPCRECASGVLAARQVGQLCSSALCSASTQAAMQPAGMLTLRWTRGLLPD